MLNVKLFITVVSRNTTENCGAVEKEYCVALRRLNNCFHLETAVQATPLCGESE